MKGEYIQEENDNNTQNTSNTPNMFAKYSHHHNHPKFQSPPPQPPHHHHPHHFPPPHHHSNHPPFLEETNSPTTIPPSQPPQQPPSKKPTTTPPPTLTQPTTSNEDGPTIELSRHPRGRPAGSKNKPKPPIIITREPEPTMSPYILELPNGADIVDSLTRLTRHRGVGFCVLTASGAVANVTLKQPSTTTTPCGTITFNGRFNILSLSAVVVNTVALHGGACGGAAGGGFTISLAGPQGQIIGGKVGGALVCSGTVYVIAASFNNPTYCKLPLDDDDEQDGHAPPQQPPQCHNNQCDDQENSLAGPTGEVIWATPSSARPLY